MAQQKYATVHATCVNIIKKQATAKMNWHLFTLNRALDSKNQSLVLGLGLVLGLLCNENIYTHVYSNRVII